MNQSTNKNKLAWLLGFGLFAGSLTMFYANASHRDAPQQPQYVAMQAQLQAYKFHSLNLATVAQKDGYIGGAVIKLEAQNAWLYVDVTYTDGDIGLGEVTMLKDGFKSSSLEIDPVLMTDIVAQINQARADSIKLGYGGAV